jgi:hypothetical protein
MFHNNMLSLNICTCLIGSFRSGFYDALDPWISNVILKTRRGAQP